MLTLIYRGSLSGCNYTCDYCPFGKTQDSRATLARDARELDRFVQWVRVEAAQRDIGVLFTPWGEAMVRRHYQHALLQLADTPGVRQVAIQTNLSGTLDWLEQAHREKLALCCTYHPGQVTLERFVKRCERLLELGIKFSVGVVAMREHYPAIRALIEMLPKHQPIWLNAFDRRSADYYDHDAVAWLDSIDPWFSFSRDPAPSQGRPCRAGSEALSVDGSGRVQRCHFIPTELGNLYTSPLSEMLQERACSRFKCDCFIGYAHRRDLPFHAEFGEGLLARIPAGRSQSDLQPALPQPA